MGPILITGAAGFIGARLCRFFAEKKQVSVIGILGTSGRNWRVDGLPAGSFRALKVDLTSSKDVATLLKAEKPAVIINCATHGAYSHQKDADRIYRTNFLAVRSLLEGARTTPGFRAFIQAGTSSEYGLNCSAPREDAPTLPDSDYAVSKVAATALVQYYGKKLGLPAWCLRLYSVYGPEEDPSRLIPKLLSAALDKRLPPLVGPKISRDFVYVEDVCRAFEAVIQHPDLPKGEIYNIGTGLKVTLQDLVRIAQETLGVTAMPSWGTLPDRPWDLQEWYGNPEKARLELGWSATTALATGLKTTLRWMRDHPELNQIAAKQSVVQV